MPITYDPALHPLHSFLRPYLSGAQASFVCVEDIQIPEDLLARVDLQNIDDTFVLENVQGDYVPVDNALNELINKFFDSLGLKPGKQQYGIQLYCSKGSLENGVGVMVIKTIDTKRKMVNIKLEKLD